MAIVRAERRKPVGTKIVGGGGGRLCKTLKCRRSGDGLSPCQNCLNSEVRIGRRLVLANSFIASIDIRPAV